jgi:pimeloyl-ACP methyl ester carboxylesterase
MANSKASWRSEALGPGRTLELAQGRIRVHETGEGAPLVFVHGLLVNANLWRKVVPGLAADFRCVTLDLPLGSHLEPLPGSALTPPALADLVIAAIEALGLGAVTLIGNDTGGAISQIVATRRPDLIDRLVLTSCDAYDVFPPKLFAYLKPFARMPAAMPLVFGALRLRALRRLPIAFGWLAKRPIDPEAEDSYVLPVLTSGAVRSDLARLLRGLDPRYTMEAAERLRSFHRPVLVAWSADERVFPRDYAERLRDDIPEASLEWVEDSYTFAPEDNPTALSGLIGGFAANPALNPAQRSSSMNS